MLDEVTKSVKNPDAKINPENQRSQGFDADLLAKKQDFNHSSNNQVINRVRDFKISPEDEELIKDVLGEEILKNYSSPKPDDENAKLENQSSFLDFNLDKSEDLNSSKAEDSNPIVSNPSKSNILEVSSSKKIDNEDSEDNKNDKSDKDDQNDKDDKNNKHNKSQNRKTRIKTSTNSIIKDSPSLDEIAIEHIQEWAIINLPIEFNLAWEIDKFKDYWLSTSKKKPTNSIAALRNWLRKAFEFKQQQEEYHAKKSSKYQSRDHQSREYKSKRSESVNENFYKAGARIIAKYEGRGLDGQNDWQNY